jgi:hypothetical protein
MPETQAVKFRRKAAECDRKAQEAAGSADRQAWLKLAEDWARLARGEDLNQEWLRIQTARSRVV